MMEKMKAIRIASQGGPENLHIEEVPVPAVEGANVLVKMSAIGVNFIDIYHRKGLYPMKTPFTPGLEASGTVVKTGPDAREFKEGDRVTYTGSIGSYAEYNLVAEKNLVRIPEGLDFKQAAAVMLQGMTAHYLALSTYSLKKESSALIHAAAGGVGLLLDQIAKMQGATVFGTVSTEEKARLAKDAGCDEVILYTQKDFKEEIERLTEGRGVDVVYDSVGKDTFERSMECLKPRGYLVLFGQSSGPVGQFDPQVLNSRGSLFLTRPSLGHYTPTREEMLKRANDILGWVASGSLKVRIGGEFPLKDAAEAHRQLAARHTTGKLLLIP